MDGPEWNTAALSPAKRALAQTLHGRLASRFAAGALLHDGQGKWYPGEPLPRWALGIFWRNDGEPLWRDASRFADTSGAGRATHEDADRFLRALARRLELPEAMVAVPDCTVCETSSSVVVTLTSLAFIPL